MNSVNWIKASAIIAAGTGAMFATPGDTNSADAAKFVVIPIGFPIADCGTVGLVNSTYPYPGGDTSETGCLAWFPDNTPGAYLVGGLDSFAVGDRVFVDGLVCNFCLTTCEAGAILDSTIAPCDAPLNGAAGPARK